jgi:hypothetical protein
MSQFRPIRPSSSSSQFHNPKEEESPPAQTVAIAAAVSDDGAQQSQLARSTSMAISTARKRKTPTHVSLNACTNCKKARAKVNTSSQATQYQFSSIDLNCSATVQSQPLARDASVAALLVNARTKYT